MRSGVFLIGLIWLAGCKKTAGSNNNNDNNIQAGNLLNVAYGADAKQTMDIYLPANRTTDSTKVIFLIHGGGWNEGDKTDFTASAGYLQTLLPGYAIVNVNYRLALNGQNIFPTQENDIKAAADFVYSKKNDYRISDKWVFIGASAGAHLALLQAYKYINPVKAKAVVSFFGPSDLVSLYNSSVVVGYALAAVVGATPSTNPGLYRQSSPYNFITAQSPPTLLLHGGADPVVPPVQSTIVRDKLQVLGVPNQYVFYPGNGHGWDGPDLLDSFDKIAAFLKLYVH